MNNLNYCFYGKAYNVLISVLNDAFYKKLLNMGDIMITKANETDLEEIIVNSVDAVRDVTTSTFKPFQGQVKNIIRTTLDQGAYYLILKEKGCLKGWILIDISKDYFKQQNVGFIYEVYVLPIYRGKGHSKELIKAAMEELSLQGCSEIRRDIRTTNFYKEIGFVNYHQR